MIYTDTSESPVQPTKSDNPCLLEKGLASFCWGSVPFVVLVLFAMQDRSPSRVLSARLPLSLLACACCLFFSRYLYGVLHLDNDVQKADLSLVSPKGSSVWDFGSLDEDVGGGLLVQRSVSFS